MATKSLYMRRPPVDPDTLLGAAARVSRLLNEFVPDATDRHKVTAAIADYTDMLLRTEPRPVPTRAKTGVLEGKE